MSPKEKQAAAPSRLKGISQRDALFNPF